MKVRVQLVENNPRARVPALFLTIHRTQIIFNPVPALLRHRKLHKLNLYNSAHIFFTKHSVEAFGGLPNYLLFRSGTEHSDSLIANKVYLYGSTRLVMHLEKLRFKLGYKALRFSFTNWATTKYRLGISSIPLFNRLKNSPQLPGLFARIEDYLRKHCSFKDYFDSRYYISTQKNQFISTDCSYFHTNQVDIYPIETEVEGVALTHYLCLFPQHQQGQDFHIERFIFETQETRNRQIKRFLTTGSITKEGRLYRKEDFLFEEDFKPSSILIFHYTSLASVEALASSPLLLNYLENKNQTGLVVHIVEDVEVLSSTLFRSFIGKFEESTKHLWFSHELHKLEGEEEYCLEENLQEQHLWSKAFPGVIKDVYLERMKYYQGRPNNLVPSLFPSLTHHLYHRVFNYVKDEFLGHRYEQRKETHPKTGKPQLLTNIITRKQQQIEKLHLLLPDQQSLRQFIPSVVFLGTNSSMPTISRNTSGILVSMTQGSRILLDCGEETYEQMANHFSPPEFQQELLKLKVVFITHIHSDHNLGILNLISERQRLLQNRGQTSKLFLVIPFNVYNWYASYNHTVQDLSQTCDVLFTQVLLSEPEEEISQPGSKASKAGPSLACNLNNFEDQFFQQLEISAKTKELVHAELPNQKQVLEDFNRFLGEENYSQFLPVRVIHCPQSFGIVIQNDQFKVSYSGDTRPSESFGQAALHSDLMIHEATFNDQDHHKAQKYRHSTVEEAVRVGKDSKSKKLALTHFNSKFRIPSTLGKLLEYSDYFEKQTIMAFDHLEVPLSGNDHLPPVSRFISEVSQEAADAYNLQKGKEN